MPDLRDYFLPYQVRWIRGPHPVAVAEKARRIGWTYASSYRAVERRVKLGTDLFYSSADLGAAREFVEACQRWARVFGAVASDLGEQVIDERDGLRALVLRFENGGRIVAGSSNPKFFRGKGGDADADEFAFHEQPRELYKAMQPAALIWGHQMRLWSTHNGEGSFFNRLIEGARRDVERRDRAAEADADGAAATADRPMTGQPTHVHRVTLIDAVNQGLAEKIRNLASPDPAARQRFLDEIRASCPDEDAWNEEYLCRPSSEQSSLLPYELIASCEAACGDVESGEVGSGGMEYRGTRDAERALRIPLPSRPTSPLPTSPPLLYAGFDVGRKHDRSALWVLERVGDVFWTRAVDVMADVTFTAQEQRLDQLMRDRAVRRLCIDATGIGAMLAERLAQRWGHRVEAIHFTAPVKAELAVPLLRLFQDRLVRVPADPDVREDLHKVRKIVTASRHVRFDAARDADGHADRFWALALAHHAAAHEPTRLVTAMSKPAGW